MRNHPNYIHSKLLIHLTLNVFENDASRLAERTRRLTLISKDINGQSRKLAWFTDFLSFVCGATKTSQFFFYDLKNEKFGQSVSDNTLAIPLMLIHQKRAKSIHSVYKTSIDLKSLFEVFLQTAFRLPELYLWILFQFNNISWYTCKHFSALETAIVLSQLRHQKLLLEVL